MWNIFNLFANTCLLHRIILLYIYGYRTYEIREIKEISEIFIYTSTRKFLVVKKLTLKLKTSNTAAYCSFGRERPLVVENNITIAQFKFKNFILRSAENSLITTKVRTKCVSVCLHAAPAAAVSPDENQP